MSTVNLGTPGRVERRGEAHVARTPRLPSSRRADLVRRYPVAAGALVGIVVGTVTWAVGHTAAASLIFAATASVAALPLVWNTARQIAQGKWNVDLIAAVAVLGALALREYLAAALVVLMQAGGEALEDYGLRRANESLDNLLRRAPSVAYRRKADSGEYESVPAAEVGVGDLLLIRPGDILAADGVIAEGQGSVDESALTGEPVPLVKGPGYPVFSGTINLTGSFVVRATSPAAQSKYERIVQMVQNAQGERAPINRLANRYTPYFTVITFLAAAVSWALTRDPDRALAVLVVATPCPLIIATPLAVLTAVNRAAAANIIVKSGAAVEQVGTAGTVIFDKTGTLTLGTPSLSGLWLTTDSGELLPADSDRTRSDLLLAGVAAVETHSPHVLGRAVVQAARERGLAIPSAVEVRERPGTGISGRACDRQYVIGSGGFLDAEGIAVPEAIRQARARLGASGQTVAYAAVDGGVVGLLAFEDRIRPDAKALVHRLGELGVRRVVMLTGDAPETAKAVADKLGITDVRSRMQPEDKRAVIEEMRASSRSDAAVLMVGDGINDAPALASADVGIAMGGYGAGIATDAADIVITVERVERVADAIALGRRMVQVARQGILIGIGVSLLLMALASAGKITPPVGALL